jgi:hypothetical protein
MGTPLRQTISITASVPLQHDIESEKTGSRDEWTLFRPD